MEKTTKSAKIGTLMAIETIYVSIEGLVGERQETRFDRTQLSLGAIVHVVQGTGALTITSSPREGSVPHSIIRAASSEPWYELCPGWVVPPRAVRVIVAAMDGVMAEQDVREALSAAQKQVPLGKQHLTKYTASSEANQFTAVAERIDLVRRLQDERCAKALFAHQEALVTYLLLTCFDLLGQPAPWKDFGSWLKSKDVRSRSFPHAATAVDQAEVLHRAWLAEYGTKHAFNRFIEDVLEPNERRALLDSFELTINTIPPTQSVRSNDDEKIRHLYRLRNQYTHKAQFFQGVIGLLDTSDVLLFGREQTFAADRWTDFATLNWPIPLERAVLSGLATRLGRWLPDDHP